MSSKLVEIFEDKKLVEKIKKKLPYLFQIAEIENTKAKRTSMEVGSLRERIIIALLIYKFGEEKIREISDIESEADIELFGDKISIKTFTGKNLINVKLIWTVDTIKAKEFYERYKPNCDMLLIQINWDSLGGLYYIPLEAQKDIFNTMRREDYIKLPKVGTNPRGVEITKNALLKLVNHNLSKKIEIHWIREKINYNPYYRWIEIWKED